MRSVYHEHLNLSPMHKEIRPHQHVAVPHDCMHSLRCLDLDWNWHAAEGS